jgi:hypothetical protein
MKIYKIINPVLPVLLGLTTGIFLSLCYRDFWELAIWMKVLLVLIISLASWICLVQIQKSMVKKIQGDENKTISLVILFLIAFLLTGIMGISIVNQVINLPTVPLKVSLSDENPNNLILPKLQIEGIFHNGQPISLNPSDVSSGCNVDEEGAYHNTTDICTLLYDVDVSRKGLLQLVFVRNQSSGVVEIQVHAHKERHDLYQDIPDTRGYEISISPDLASRRIRYPLVFFGLCAIAGWLFVTLLLLHVYLLNRLEKLRSRFSNVRSDIYTAAIYYSFILGALFYSAGWLGNHPLSFVNLESDAANIASFCAAYDHPDNFLRDPFLSDEANFRSYFAFHIPLIRALASLTGSYASAFSVLLFPIIVLHYFGYYFLGVKIFSSKYYAFLFAWIVAMPIKMPVSEFYGLSLDVIPRFLFQSVLPFLLLWMMKIIQKPRQWWLGALLFSASLYLHPVSGPAWILAYFLTILVIFRGKNTISWWINYLGAAMVSLIAIIPFIMTFFGTAHSDSISMDFLQKITEVRLTSQTESMLELYGRYFSTYVLDNWSMLVLWGITGFFLIITACFVMGICRNLWIDHGVVPNQTHLTILSWWLAVLIVSIVFPIIDELYVKITGNLQVLREIRRTMRYFIPLLWLTFFWISVRFHLWLQTYEKNGTRHLELYGKILSLFFAIAYLVQIRPDQNLAIQNQISCLQQGRLVCEVTGNEAEKIEFYDVLPTIVNQQQLIFPDPSPAYMKDTLIPRYYSLRSIAYTYKDGGSTGNTSIEFIEDWWKTSQQIKPYLPTSEKPLDIKVLDIAKQTGAEYFIFIYPDQDILLTLAQERISFQNAYGVLYYLK